MKKLLTLLLLIPCFCVAQKKAPYKYGEVDSVIQYQDAQIISYKKDGKQKRDTIWTATQKKDIEIDWSRVVITDSRFLKPRIKFKQ